MPALLVVFILRTAGNIWDCTEVHKQWSTLHGENNTLIIVDYHLQFIPLQAINNSLMNQLFASQQE